MGVVQTKRVLVVVVVLRKLSFQVCLQERLLVSPLDKVVGAVVLLVVLQELGVTAGELEAQLQQEVLELVEELEELEELA